MTISRNDLLRGLRSGLPIVLSTAPFGMLFGAIAVDNGLTIGEATLMSMSVFAGASQIVGMDLFGHNVPGWLIVLSILAVNFRHVLYSASVGRYIAHFPPMRRAIAFFLLTDPQFAETVREHHARPPVSLTWYMTMGLVTYVFWVGLSFLGAYLGRFIGDPKAIALDVLLPIFFLGLVMGFRKQHGWVPVVSASIVGSVAGFYVFGSPWHVTVGAVAGVIAGALLPPKAEPQGESENRIVGEEA